MRTVRVAAAATVLLLAAACAEPGSEPSGSGLDSGSESTVEFERRAAAVVDAWLGSEEVTAWRTGLLLLEPPTMVPPDPGPEDVALALRAGWLRTDLEPSVDSPGGGEVEFGDGEVLPVPLVSLAEAWQAVHTGDPECPGTATPPPSPGSDPDEPVSGPAGCTVLTVTEAYLDVVTVATSRGPAQVPAWLFEVAEVDEPLGRVAVAPEQIADVPLLDEIQFAHFEGLATAATLVQADGVRLRYQLGVGACDAEPAALVYETDEVVVLGGTSRPEPGTTACTDQLVLAEVSVQLTEPVGQRPVFATTGEALTFGRW